MVFVAPLFGSSPGSSPEHGQSWSRFKAALTAADPDKTGTCDVVVHALFASSIPETNQFNLVVVWVDFLCVSLFVFMLIRIAAFVFWLMEMQNECKRGLKSELVGED